MGDRSPHPPPTIEVDPTTGRPVLMAPKRQARPILTASDRDAECPFCPGQEHQTPPEVAAIRAPDTAADRPGWRVRAFPNLYPAAARHEVIAEGAEHHEQPSAMSAAGWGEVLQMWTRRIAAVEADDSVRCAFLFKNVGRLAGASIAHNHSQLLGLPMVPPRLQLELKQVQKLAQCPFQQTLQSAEREGRLVYGNDHYAALCPRPPKLPFETWLLPRDRDEDLLALPHAESLADCLHALFTAVDRAFDGPAFNLYLHRIPGADFWWHFELQPRTGFLAGLELGGDMYINAVPAAQAAARLRRALQR